MVEYTRVAGPDADRAPFIEPHGHIVVGVDGSEESVDALRTAASIASALSAPLHVLAAWHSPDYASWNPEADAAHAARDSVREVFGEHWPSGLEVLTAPGDAADVLVAAGRTAQMLVVGRRGRTGLARYLGSVSLACVTRAECPVLVTHPRPSAEGAEA